MLNLMEKVLDFVQDGGVRIGMDGMGRYQYNIHSGGATVEYGEVQ